MLLSRRRFLRLSVVATASAVTALVALESAKDWLLSTVRALYRQVLSPTLADAPTGRLGARAFNALLSTTRAVAGVPVQMSHYEDFFRWRAENLRGYKALYEQFAEALDRRARQSFGCDFVECNREVQRRIIEKVRQVHSTDTRWERIRASVFERDWLLFERYIIRDMLLLFSRTDAWTLLGYEAWPGTPRGLDQYTKAPSERQHVSSPR